MTRLACLLAGAALAAPAAALPPPPTVFAIVDVTVVPMDAERLLPGRTVIVRDGVIERIGAADAVAVPAEAMTIRGRGRYLMPGLAEMHAHVPPQAEPRQWTDDVLFLYVANGITTARSMLGAPHHLALRGQAAAGRIVAPRLLLSGPSLNGNSVADAAAGRRMVAEQAAAGYDFLKIHPGLDRARYDAVAAAAAEHGIRFGGHVPDAVGLERALAAGQATIDHLDGFMPPLTPGSDPTPAFFGWNLADDADGSRIAPLAGRVAAAGAWVVPTESLMQHLLMPAPDAAALAARDEMRYVPAAMRAQWRDAKRELQADDDFDPALAARFIAVRARLLVALQEAGVLLLGSDAPQVFNVPGFSIHHELRMLVDAGLTPYQALASGSVNVARFLGEPARSGQVAEGMRADLLLLEANPLDDVANLQRRAGVMLNGRWLPEFELQAGLAQIAKRYQQDQQ